ncbi:hypothetical protein B0H13DRAFT_2317854 [Mycena leptocephala]|nr:hypothetical protein B0H13DRAFT_2317854 [Mycena leptocephala]
MTDNTATRFPMLKSSNYPEWAIRMESTLIKKGLWSVIVKILVNRFDEDGKEKGEDMIEAECEKIIAKQDPMKMAETCAEMILRVDDGQLAHMTVRDPMVVWEDLQRVYHAAGFATSLALRQKFLIARKLDDETMEAWIG